MTTRLPGWLTGVLDLVGMHFPEGDEDKLAQRGHAFDAEAAALEADGDEFKRIVGLIEEAVGGKIETAVKEFIDQLVTQSLRPDQQNQKQLAEQARAMAEATQFGKYEIILTLAALAVQLLWCAANFWNGSGEVEAAAAVAVTRGIVADILEQIGLKTLAKIASSQVVKFAAKQAAIGAAMGAGVDAGAQGLQIAQGTRHGFDVKQFAADTAAGAVGGAVGGLAGHAVAGKEAQTLLGKLGKNALGGAVGGGAGAVAGGLTGGLIQGGISHALDGAGGQALLGGVMGAGAGARGAHFAPEAKPVEAAPAHEAPHIDIGKPGEAVPSAKPGGTGEPTPSSALAAQEHPNGQGHDTAAPVAQPREDPAARDQHEQSAQAVSPADQRSTVGEPKPGTEQRATPNGDPQRAVPSSDPTRTTSPNGDRPLTGREQPAPNTSGERAAAPGPRLPEQPAASLSNTARDKHLAGAASATTREAPVVKATEPVTAKTSEPVRAVAGVPEARPVEQRPAVEPKHAEGNTTEVEPSARRDDHAGISREADTGAPRDTGRSPEDSTHGHSYHTNDSTLSREHHDSVPPRENGSDDHTAMLRDVLDGREPLFHGDEPTPVEKQALRDLWEHATPEERAELFKQHPMFGEHAELPTRETDQHARQAAESLRDELRDKQDREGLTRDEQRRLRALDNILDSVHYGPDQTPRFLLGFEHDGRSITSIGNPDTSTHTVVFAPGTFTSHEKLNQHLEDRSVKNLCGLREPEQKPGYMEVSRRMHDSLAYEVGHENVAVVDYQNYHAPQHLKRPWSGAANPKYAKAGAGALRNHCDRLQHTNQVEGNKLLVTGHSYGTVLVGEAAKGGHGLNADGILNLGSPGLRVADVTGLQLKGQHLSPGDGRVHTMTRPDDPIRLVDYARKLHLDKLGIGHGLMPHHEAFGSTVHTTGHDPAGPRHHDPHSAYFDERGVEMKNIGKIADKLDQLPEPPPEIKPRPDSTSGPHSPDTEHPHPSPDESYIASDLARDTAHSIYECAVAAEPAISGTVVEAVSSVGGHMERFEYRLKTEHSLARKLDSELEFVDPSDLEKIEKVKADIKDSVRYTAIVPDDGYWASGNSVAAALSDKGYTLQKSPPGWAREGYKGRNMTFKGPDGVEFEVQVHTRSSLDAAEQAHKLYEVERLPTTPLEEKQRLREIMRAIFDQVPVPPGTPWKD
ncbi:hypothetical protein [Segniliparus rugosus]|uniref:Outer membrane channel protein CpnT-like N-terminal domain-containing protein n=1 Tax=Segniliparus rugosus (strain ATCC BAA-974 / DSM 45345 / CCUG 50838 / CIP 108380 / JCM 13579 / CDC 945) TaxID=679197 RepID=E5XLP7_SEGRC|nr:hypothetical protein [Segniliparus rugosus]EFV14725.1 hypothetical protein HMPREF9336_00416 [Segniliparus rugosus ATCC BAA-974]